MAVKCLIGTMLLLIILSLYCCLRVGSMEDEAMGIEGEGDKENG